MESACLRTTSWMETFDRTLGMMRGGGWIYGGYVVLEIYDSSGRENLVDSV